MSQGKTNSYQSIAKNLSDFLYSWMDIETDLKQNKLRAYAVDHFRDSFKT